MKRPTFETAAVRWALAVLAALAGTTASRDQ